MSDKSNTVPPLELDLRGFQRRLPRAAITWLVGQLDTGDTLPALVDAAAECDVLADTLRSCGADIISDESSGEGRRLVLRKSAVRSIVRELDMRGRRCPEPVIEARRQLRKMSSGERLRMLADCTGSPAEVNTWAANSATVAMLGKWRQGNDFVFLIGRQ